METNDELEAEARGQTLPGTPNSALLLDIVRALAMHKDGVVVESRPIGSQARGEVLRLTVADDDYPKVRGSQRRTEAALGMLLKFVGAKEGRTVRLLVPEPPEHASRPGVDVGEYDGELLRSLAEKVLGRVLSLPFTVEVIDMVEKVAIEVRPDQREEELLEQLIFYSGIVFHAIGRHMGRDLYIEAVPEIPKAKR